MGLKSFFTHEKTLFYGVLTNLYLPCTLFVIIASITSTVIVEQASEANQEFLFKFEIENLNDDTDYTFIFNDKSKFRGLYWELMNGAEDLRFCNIYLEEISSPSVEFRKVKKLSFRENPNLKTLNLKFMEKFPNIEELRIFNCLKIKVPEKVLKKCKDLKVLKVSNSGDLNEVPNGVKSLSKLCALDLSYNKIKKFDPKELKKSKELRYLDLSHNEGIELLENYWEYLDNLGVFIATHCELLCIPEGINGLRSLEKLNVSYNRLVEVDLEVFKGMSCLCDLDLSENPGLSLSDDGWENIANVTSLCLNANKFGKIPDGISKLKKLEQFYARDNDLKEVNLHIFKDVEALHVLDIESNKGVVISKDGWEHVSHLKVLNMQCCDLNNIPLGLNQLVCLKEFNISGNRLTALNFDQLVDLETLNISDNELVELNLDQLKKMKELKVLDFSKNKGIKIGQTSVNGMTGLTKIVMSDCGLAELPSQFLELPNLEGFIARNNSVKVITSYFIFRAIKSKNLKFIDLKGNKIVAVPRTFLKLADKNVVIDLRENCIPEECNGLWVGKKELKEKFGEKIEID